MPVVKSPNRATAVATPAATPAIRTGRTSATSWTLVLPITSPLSMNDRMHWRQRAEQVRDLRGATFLLAKHAKVDKGCARVRITLHYQPADRRHRDAINLAPTLKACEDGLVDARIVTDDTPEFIDPQMPVIDPWQPGSKRGLLWLEIERLL